MTSMTPSRAARIEDSRVDRQGYRYYKTDESYDKRLYENDAKNYARIIATLILFWIGCSLFWWGIFELGINAS